MADIVMKKGDLLPSISYRLGVDLTQASNVAFKFQPTSGGTVRSGNCAILSTSTGDVRYDWISGDTATAGDFRCEFVATFTNSRDMTFPASGFLYLTVYQDVS